MPFFNSVRAIGPSGSRRLLAKLKAFVDTFTRGNSASALGQDVAKWNAVSGTWGINANRGYSTTPASSYPLATFDAITKDVTIKATGAGGSGYGVSFWVTDNGNWWGAHTAKTSYAAAPYTCNSNGHTANNTNGNCAYTYGASGGPTYGGGPYACCPAGQLTSGWDCYSGPPWVKIEPPASAPACPSPYNTHPAPYNCPSGGSVSGSTCYVTYAGTGTTWYQHDVKVVKNTSGAISQVSTTNVGNNVSNNAYVSFVQAVTGSASAVITAQLSTGGPAVSVTVPSGTPIRTSKFGTIAGPSGLSASTEVETFEYNPL